jgi:sulfur-oxidizing protein SoxX
VSKLSAHPFHGEIGPPLDGVAERYEEPQLRLQVVNAKAINPDTIMPAFYRTDGFHRVLDKFKDKPVLTAQEVEDVVAYLKTLK